MGRYGNFELDIKVGATGDPSFKTDAVREAMYEAARLIKSAVMAEVVKNNQEAREAAIKERTRIIELFDSIVYVEEIPNGYCSDWCCKHLPWFVITTPVGKFKIGWRKSVMNIDWEQTLCTKTAEELFPNDDVTKSGRSIHSWSYENAKRYITTIYANKN